MRNSRLIGAVLGAALAFGLGAGASVAAPVGGDFVIGPTSPGKWGNPVFGTGATVTYSFIATGTSTGGEGAGAFSHLSSFMPVGWQAAISSAFSAWSAVANLTFVEVADTGEAFNAPGASGDIRIGGHFFDGAGGVLAHGYYPPNNGDTAAGDIHFDTGDLWKIGFGGAGFDLFQVMAHEVGHALGLDHTGVAGSLMNPFYTEAFAGPQADDIAGMQYIYGRPISPVPLPAALPLLGGGLLILGFVRRRKSSKTEAA